MFLSMLCLFTIIITIYGLNWSEEKTPIDMVHSTTSKPETPVLRGDPYALSLFYN